VIALGVLHSSGVDTYRTALDDRQTDDVRRAALAEVAGGWACPGDAIETPFGDLPSIAATEDDHVPVRLDRSGVLSDEFSLDTFCALLRRAADLLAVSPPSVLRLFVGPTRDPIDGSFAVAERLAEWIRATTDRATAIVTTGDLVHYGTAYGDPDADASQPLDGITERFRDVVDRALRAGLAGRDWESAHHLSSDLLRNDQREILPVVSALLGPAEARLLHFELSDYAGILDVAPPCLVATALAAYECQVQA
jgi:hypothetical protein